MRLSWKSALALVVGGVLIGSMASVAAQTSEPESPDAPTERVRHAGPRHMKAPMRAIRSEVVLPGNDGEGVRTVRTDRGELTTVEGSTLVIAEEDGTTVRVDVGEDTRISRDGERAELSELQSGDQVITVRERVGDGETTTRGVRAFSPARWTEMQERRDEMRERRSKLREGRTRPGMSAPAAA